MVLHYSIRFPGITLLCFLASFIFLACNGSDDSIVIDSTAVRYDDAIMPYDEAEKLGAFLRQEGFTDSITTTVEVEKEGLVWLVRMEVIEDVLTMPEMENRFALLAADISRVIFNRDPVEIHLCGKGMTTMKIIRAAKGFRHKIAVDGVEIYFDGDQVKYEESQALAEYLNVIGFAEDVGLISQLARVNNKLQFRIVFDQQLIDDPDIETVFSLLASQLSREHLYGQTLEIHLCDGNFMTKKIIQADPGLSFSLEYDHIKIFFDDSNVSPQDVDRLGGFLLSIGFAEGQMVSIQMERKDKTWLFRMVTSEDLWYDEHYHVLVAEFVSMLSLELYEGNPVEFHICDGVFVTRMVIPSLVMGLD